MSARVQRPARGFTLIELTVSMLILGLIAGALVLNFTQLGRGAALDESSVRFETALRMARAEAATRGRRIRVSLNPDDGGIGVLWEPDPLEHPDAFADFTAGPGSTWSKAIPSDTVRVTRFEPRGGSGSLFGGGGPGVTFEPDGSSDSALIELTSRDESEPRRLEVELDGVSGEIRVKKVTPEE